MKSFARPFNNGMQSFGRPFNIIQAFSMPFNVIQFSTKHYQRYTIIYYGLSTLYNHLICLSTTLCNHLVGLSTLYKHLVCLSALYNLLLNIINVIQSSTRPYQRDTIIWYAFQQRYTIILVCFSTLYNLLLDIINAMQSFVKS